MPIAEGVIEATPSAVCWMLSSRSEIELVNPPDRRLVQIMTDVLARGGSTDDALLALRASGASLIDSTKVIIEVQGLSLGQAKWVLDGSKAWADSQRALQRLRNGIVEDLVAVDDPDVTLTIRDEEVEVIVKTGFEESETWTLRDQGKQIARWEVTGTDFPSLEAIVHREPGFEQVRELFDEDLRLLEALDDGDLRTVERFEEHYRTIQARLELVGPDGVAVQEFLLHIDGDKAWWKWSETRFPDPAE